RSSAAVVRRPGKRRRSIAANPKKGDFMSAGHGHGGGDHGGNKGIALLISVLALVLAFSETFGKSAQTAALAYNIEASNLWAFFQAKTIRQTVLRTAAEQTEVYGTDAEGQK